jgi:carboxyl-terminal processing protease
MRNVVAFALLGLLALSAFVAGYFTNDLVELQQGITTVSVESQGDFALFWEAWGLVENSFLGELPTDKELTYGAIRGALGLLNDPYTFFVEPVAREQERQSLQGTYGGIGASLRRPEEGGEIILEPLAGNPAEVAGIVFGDVLLAVDGTEITPEMTVQEVADLIRGEKGTVVVLTVHHEGDETPVDVAIERGDILIPSVSYRILTEDPTIGYVQLSRFSGESEREVGEAIVALQEAGATRLILDLRGNGGGLLDAAVDVADHFVADGTLLIQQTRGEDERIYNASRDTLAQDMPLIILVDGGSASSSEILAGALQDRERAMLIGSGPTYGKGSVQLVYDLSDGSSVHVTSSRWFTPDRHQIDQQGLQPDVLVEVTQDDIDNGRDAVLQRAIEEFQQTE